MSESLIKAVGRFEYVAYDEDAASKQAAFKEKVEDIEKIVNGWLPRGRAQSLALTKLEEFYMWVGKAIRDEQVGNG